MKFLHLSDLHLGKQMNDVSALADQEAVLLGQVVPHHAAGKRGRGADRGGRLPARDAAGRGRGAV